MSDKIKIGIPKSLLWHKYGVFWEVFFKELGCKVLLSSDTNEKIVEQGVRVSIDELCIPIKIFYGHFLELYGKCDKIFVPRYWKLDRKSVTCPKLITLTDTANQVIKANDSSIILSSVINVTKRPISISFLELGLKINKNLFKVMRAYKKALLLYQEKKIRDEKKFNDILSKNSLKIAVIGHEYNINDKYINQKLITQIKIQGADCITPEIIPKKLCERYLEGKPFIHWSYEKEIIGAAYWAIASKKISGIILVSSFNCGPDSLLYEQLLLDIKKKPVLSVLLDEYTSSETINTRIEAFVELLRRKKRMNTHE
jgi:predicted nucleotide-binding protein (sugar kinase/HSP70/actin superfamily)